MSGAAGAGGPACPSCAAPMAEQTGPGRVGILEDGAPVDLPADLPLWTCERCRIQLIDAAQSDAVRRLALEQIAERIGDEDASFFPAESPPATCAECGGTFEFRSAAGVFLLSGLVPIELAEPVYFGECPGCHAQLFPSAAMVTIDRAVRARTGAA